MQKLCLSMLAVAAAASPATALDSGMKAGLLAHMQGYPPAVSVEFARKVLLSTERPNFYEVEQAVSALPPV